MKIDYTEMWAVIFPDGRIVTGSDLQSEEDAWRIALGWPDKDDILAAKNSGVVACKAKLMYPRPVRTFRSPTK